MTWSSPPPYAAVHRRLERPAGGRPEESRRDAHRHVASGPAQRDLSRVSHRRASGPARRHVARHAGRLLCVTAPTRVAPRRLFGVTPDMIEVYSRFDRHPLPLGQVRPDHGRGFLRRDGERERRHARGLAPRRARLPRPAVVSVDPDPARAGPPMVRRLCDPRELGQHGGSTRASPSSSRGSTGASSSGPHAEDDYYLDEYHQYLQIDRQRVCPSPRWARTTCTPRARWCCGCSSVIWVPSGSGHRLQAYLTHTPWETRRPTICAKACSTRRARISTGSGVNGSTTRGTPVRGDGGLRHRGSQADPHGEADAGGFDKGR